MSQPEMTGTKITEFYEQFNFDIYRQIAVEWHQPSHEEGLRFELQQRQEAEGGPDLGWRNIYSDKNDYFILPAIFRGRRT